MAISGVITNSIHSGHYTLRIAWSATQNVTNNTSTITADMYLVQDSGWSLNIRARSNTLSIDGVATSVNSPAIDNGGGRTTLLGSTTRTVTHNGDGTRNVTISGTFNIDATISGTKYTSITASATVQLDTIPRASSFTLSASTVTLGSTIGVSITRHSSSFTHRLRYSWGQTSGTIASGVGTSYTWTVPLALAEGIPNGTSGTCYITVDTMSGSTVIGSVTKSFTGTVPANILPTISRITLSDASDAIPAGWGVYVKGKSTLNIVTAASGAYGSKIASYSVKANGGTYTSANATTGVLTQTGALYAVVTVTDTRGRTASQSVAYTVLDYKPPVVSVFDVRRVNGAGEDDDDGTTAKVAYGASVSDAGGNNTGTLTIYYKPTTDIEWTMAKTAPVAPSASGVITIAGINTENAYDFKAVVTDTFTESAADAQVQTAVVTMDFNSSGRGIAFGKVSEYDAFECAMPAIFSNTFRVDGGVNPTHTAGVTAVTGSDGAGKYIKLLSFPINTYSGWNYSSLVLSFEECVFGAFSGILDIHIRNSMTNGTIGQKVFTCHSYRGDPRYFQFYLVITNNIVSVYWLCQTNQHGISVRVLNGYMPHAGFDGITWSDTSSTGVPGGERCTYSGALNPAGITAHRNASNQNLTMADTYETIKWTSSTVAGSGLSLNSDGGIVIGDGVSMVRIGGQLTVGAQSNGLKYAAIWTSVSSTHLARAQASITTAAPQTLNFAPKLVSVTPGTVLTVRLYGAQGDVVYGGTMQSYFTVEAVG